MDCGDALNMSDDILQKSIEANGKLIFNKFGDRYKKEFQLFYDWRKENNAKKITKNVMLAYFLDLSKKLSSSSLWTKYSMVKSMLLMNENVDISRFIKVKAFLKKMPIGFEPPQCKAFTRDDVNRFYKEANDETYLLKKIVTIFGIAGGSRREKLHNMSLNDVQDTGSQLVVTIPQIKTNQKKVFTVINMVDEINYLELFRKYIVLRPKQLQCNKIFIRFGNGKCVPQRIGIHIIGAMPKKIAEFLNLENPEKYTGHCFRRKSGTLLANADVNLTVLKRHGGWRSSSVAEKYIEDSMLGKQKIARMIQGGESFVEVLQEKNTKTSTTISTKNSGKVPSISIQENANYSININLRFIYRTEMSLGNQRLRYSMK